MQLMSRTAQNVNPFATAEAADLVRAARAVVALTGAGISVASGIPDFRSPGGLWSVFTPDEYATVEAFRRDPAKAWRLYRALAKTLVDKTPNPAHRALAELEHSGRLRGVVTQNIDGLHQQAGSSRVFEIHGDHQRLQCLQCGGLRPLQPEHLKPAAQPPCCPDCGFPLKPNVVLFGEPVRDLEAIHAFVADCDLLLVIGTSAQVYPAAALPARVDRNGGRVIECNREPILSDSAHNATLCSRALFLQGDVVRTLPALAAACRER